MIHVGILLSPRVFLESPYCSCVCAFHTGWCGPDNGYGSNARIT